MPLSFFFLINRQGKTRLQKWFIAYHVREKQRILKDLTTQILNRKRDMANIIEYRTSFRSLNNQLITINNKVVYKKYASLYFAAGIDETDNELIALEMIHRYVEVLDKHFGNVCELDLVFNFEKTHFVFDELFIAGELQDSSKKGPLRFLSNQDAIEETEKELDNPINQFMKYAEGSSSSSSNPK